MCVYLYTLMSSVNLFLLVDKRLYRFPRKKACQSSGATNLGRVCVCVGG